MSVPPESYFCYCYEVNEFPAHALADNAYHICMINMENTKMMKISYVLRFLFLISDGLNLSPLHAFYL